MKDNGKVPIELRPYDALEIICFLREFVNDQNKNDRRFASLHEAVTAYENEIFTKLTSEQLEAAKLEMKVNQITGRVPEKE